MPKNNSILNLPGFVVKKISGLNPIYMDVKYRRTARCIHCKSKNLRKKDSFTRQVRHVWFGNRRSYLRFKAHKFQCRSCGRYFNQRFPGIKKYQRGTEKLHEQVFRAHTQGVSQKDLARDLKAGKSTVERWYQSVYQQ